MPDLMSRTEARLRELYDFENMKPKFFTGTTIYSVEVDERAFIFLNEFIILDYHKIEQIRNVQELILCTEIGLFDQGDNTIQIIFKPEMILFSWSTIVNIRFFPNKTLEDLYISIYNKKTNYTKLLDKYSFDYDSIYEEKLSELRELIPSPITASHFLSAMNTSIEDIINSKITDGSILYLGEDEFIEKCNNLKIENKQHKGSISFEKSFDFILKPKEIRKALSSFFSNDKVDEIVYALSLLAFKTVIENPVINFKDMKGCISLNEHTNKFNDHYHCYSINIMLSNNEKYRNYRYLPTFLNITTHAHFISYEKILIGKDYVSFEGIHNVSKGIINDISDIFESRLGITRDEINAKQLSLLLMMNS